MLFHCANTTFDLQSKTHVMGILNCTPDSFYSGSRRTTLKQAVDAGIRMVEQGADFLDVGGESSRPGSEPVAAEEECRRVLPVIEQLQREVKTPISIDTYRADTARKAIDLGAAIINDISALQFDSEMAKVASRTKTPVILMHIKGRPRNMQADPYYDDVISEISAYLHERVDFAVASGIPYENIVIDPGIGFGKRLSDNYEITHKLDSFVALGHPLLYGASRKSFLGRVLNLPPEECLEATLAMNTVAILRGAHILRVHDVMQTRRAASAIDYLKKTTTQTDMKSQA